MLRFLFEVVWVWRGTAPTNTRPAQPLPACALHSKARHTMVIVSAPKSGLKGLHIVPFMGTYSGFWEYIWLPYLAAVLHGHPYSLFLFPIWLPLFSYQSPPYPMPAPYSYSHFGWLKFLITSFNVRVFRPSFVQSHMFSLRPGFGNGRVPGPAARRTRAPAPWSSCGLELQHICQITHQIIFGPKHAHRILEGPQGPIPPCNKMRSSSCRWLYG